MLKKAKINTSECVACGVCQKKCALNAISIYKGRYAIVDTDKCIGCGNCVNVCPASVIEISVLEDKI